MVGGDQSIIKTYFRAEPPPDSTSTFQSILAKILKNRKSSNFWKFCVRSQKMSIIEQKSWQETPDNFFFYSFWATLQSYITHGMTPRVDFWGFFFLKTIKNACKNSKILLKLYFQNIWGPLPKKNMKILTFSIFTH